MQWLDQLFASLGTYVNNSEIKAKITEQDLIVLYPFKIVKI